MLALGALAVAGSSTLDLGFSPLFAAQSRTSPTYTPDQAARGETIYAQSCASCHGEHLDDGEFAAPLSGVEFRQRWGARSLDTLFAEVSTTMPPTGPGALSDGEYADVLAYVLRQNGVEPGDRPLPTDLDALAPMFVPGAARGPGGGLTAAITLPAWPVAPGPLGAITPATDDVLASPPDGDWLNWRRTYDAHGFSPLAQIDRDNVGGLRVAWTWSLPNGPNEATPLVHDGVLFVHGYGDRVQALDAATGDLLWQYWRRLPEGARTSVKRTIALYGDRLYVPTSDTHIVALDVASGNVVWDHAVADYRQGYGMTGGPLVAKGKVMVGTTGRAPGGNFIVALDAGTGDEAWRFSAIAPPGDPGDSWNGLPLGARSGGSVWVAGSYDPALGLAFFGPAPTYDTGPLRNRTDDARNDALYTDTTLAIDPDTGRLVWYFQHQPNDQWDYDWAFERQLVELNLNGGRARAVVTGGKQMIFDAVEAESGRYLFSVDLGLQNVVTAIDPVTGAKTVDPRQIPGDGEPKMVCPHAGGGRSWLPTSFDATSRILYIPLVESCMDLTPVAPGGRGGLSTGVRWSVRPPPDSDGRYGRVEAINLETREVVWTRRQRAPQTTGVLATAGGVVFAGSLDRAFLALDAATGDELWRVRLNDVPSSAPITYSVGGRQYVAMVVGNGGAQAVSFPLLVPEIHNPPEPGAAIWVFALPD